MLLNKLPLTRRALNGILQTAPKSSRRSSYYVYRLAAAASLLASLNSKGAVLVGLDPTTALYDSDLKGIVDDGGTAGSKSGVPVLGDTQHVAGATFNIAFTPAAGDLDGKTVLLIELGGTSNGIGLYLVDGVPTLLSKQGSNDVTVPGSLNDTSLPAIAVQSPIGKLNAGTAYSFSGSWNHANTVELVVKPDGGAAVTSRHAISGTPSNWSGNDTLSVKTISSAGSVGGLAGSNAGNNLGLPFDVNNASNFLGTVTRALFWNASAVTPPVPSAPEVLGFAVTPLPSSGQVRLHWKVTEGGAPAATNIAIKADSTVIYAPTTLEGFKDLAASAAANFTLSATNATGTTEKNTVLPEESAYAAAVRVDLPRAWYRFNEATGEQLIVDSAEGAAPNNGRTYGASPTGSTGFLDGAALFDGGSGIILPTVFDPGAPGSGFTIEAIVKRAPGVVGANPVVVAQRGTTGRVHLSSAADGKILTDLGGGEWKQADAGLNDNAWAHLAVVVDAQHTEIRWYLDGVLVGSSKDGLNPDGSTFNPDFLLESSTGEWIVGLGKALTGNYWKGSIDEVAIFRSVLDDPDGDGDKADSRIPAHRNAWWGETAGLLDFSASKTTVSAGDAVQLTVRVGTGIPSVSIDQNVGTIPVVDGRATITINPTTTKTYQVTAGSATRSVTVTALQYQAPIVKGFQVTKLGTPGQVRLHWKVSQGEAPNPTTLTIKAGATVLHETTTLQGFVDVAAGEASAFTLNAVNATGTTEVADTLDAENGFSAAVRADAPIAWFRFNEAAGSELFVDSADNVAPHNGSPSGTPVSGVAGVVDGAITLNENGAVVTDLILNPAQLDPGFTIEAVVRRDPTNGNANRAIVSQTDVNGTGRVLLSVADSDGRARTYLGQGVRKDADGKLAEETWAHLIVVVDALNTEVRWYLDGEFIGSSDDGQNPDGSTFDPNFTFETSEGAWVIGAQKLLVNDRWRGEIDEVVVYNSLLDDPDANDDRADSKIAAHRTAWWNETSGLIQLNAAATTLVPGESTQLTIKVGPDITSVSIDPVIGAVDLVNGNAVVTLSPTATTTYTITFNGPGGSFTQTITIQVGTPAELKVLSSAVQGGNLVVSFSGAASTTYAVKGSLTLGDGFPEALGTVTTDASGAGTVNVPVVPGVIRKFVRIEEIE